MRRDTVLAVCLDLDVVERDADVLTHLGQVIAVNSGAACPDLRPDGVQFLSLLKRGTGVVVPPRPHDVHGLLITHLERNDYGSVDGAAPVVVTTGSANLEFECLARCHSLLLLLVIVIETTKGPHTIRG